MKKKNIISLNGRRYKVQYDHNIVQASYNRRGSLNEVRLKIGVRNLTCQFIRNPWGKPSFKMPEGQLV